MKAIDIEVDDPDIELWHRIDKSKGSSKKKRFVSATVKK